MQQPVNVIDAHMRPCAALVELLLLERNGLQHGGFELPPAPGGGAAIEQLAWSPDSEFLAIVLAQAGDDGAAGMGARGRVKAGRLLA